METTGIIVAAGESERFNGDDKQLAGLNSRPVLFYSIDLFERVSSMTEVVLVSHPQNLDRFEDLVSQVDPTTSFQVVTGGDTRHESVRRGLDTAENAGETVMIHDGARPGVDVEICRQLIDRYFSEDDVKAVVPVIKIPDTVKRIDREDRVVDRTLDRRFLRRVQTPQLFELGTLRESLDSWSRDEVPTDESLLLEAAGHPVGIVEGSPRYRKVTNRDDLRILETFMRAKTDG